MLSKFPEQELRCSDKVRILDILIKTPHQNQIMRKSSWMLISGFSGAGVF
jgi:hypothetical protein